MTWEAAAAFGLAITVWALVPGPGLAAVLASALGAGRKSAAAVVAGLVAADLVFLAVAVLGLFALAKTLGPVFEAIKYLGAAYLIWRGLQLFRAPNERTSAEARPGGVLRSAGVGLLITLGNPKAILFFGAILPAFVDVSTISLVDFVTLSGIVAGASFLVYGAYAELALRAGRFTSGRLRRKLRWMGGSLLVGSGLLVATR